MPRRNLLWLFLGLTGGAVLVLWAANQTGASGDPPPYRCLLDA